MLLLVDGIDCRYVLPIQAFVNVDQSVNKLSFSLVDFRLAVGELDCALLKPQSGVSRCGFLLGDASMQFSLTAIQIALPVIEMCSQLLGLQAELLNQLGRHGVGA